MLKSRYTQIELVSQNQQCYIFHIMLYTEAIRPKEPPQRDLRVKNN